MVFGACARAASAYCFAFRLGDDGGGRGARFLSLLCKRPRYAVYARACRGGDDCDAAFARAGRGGEKRKAMLVFSVTLHNVPEGLCIGVAFGAVSLGVGDGLAPACLLALGIALQNFPEGAAISLPLRQGGFARARAFFWGNISGAAEPIAAVFGAVFVLAVRAALPFSLAFAAGAMIYVVAAELLPESAEKSGAAAFSAIVGFSIMMLMDTAFA